MKLSTLKNNSRDGQLVVVSRDLKKAILAAPIAPTLQYALDNWQTTKPQLEELSQALNAGQAEHAFNFDPSKATAPLPRAYQWADGSAYVNHVELVRKARGATMPASFWTDPLLYQGGSDSFLGPRDDILVANEADGIDFEAEVAVITNDVPMETNADTAQRHIVLVMLVNDVSLRNLIPNEIAKGFGFFHSKPSTAFSACAVTPDELGDAWTGDTIQLPLRSFLNGKLYGEPNVGIDMTFGFPQLIAHAAKTRSLTAGSIIGSGTVSNRDRTRGSSCIAEKRMLEKMETGTFQTPFMQFGDKIRIEMKDKDGQDIFGAIDQVVKHYKKGK